MQLYVLVKCTFVLDLYLYIYYALQFSMVWICISSIPSISNTKGLFFNTFHALHNYFQEHNTFKLILRGASLNNVVRKHKLSIQHKSKPQRNVLITSHNEICILGTHRTPSSGMWWHSTIQHLSERYSSNCQNINIKKKIELEIGSPADVSILLNYLLL